MIENVLTFVVCFLITICLIMFFDWLMVVKERKWKKKYESLENRRFSLVVENGDLTLKLFDARQENNRLMNDKMILQKQREEYRIENKRLLEVHKFMGNQIDELRIENKMLQKNTTRVYGGFVCDMCCKNNRENNTASKGRSMTVIESLPSLESHRVNGINVVKIGGFHVVEHDGFFTQISNGDKLIINSEWRVEKCTKE